MASTSLLLACGSSEPGDLGEDSAADATPEPDAPPQTASIPTWTLEDIQELSPRFGQTYGLEAFTDEIVVALLVEGF